MAQAAPGGNLPRFEQLPLEIQQAIAEQYLGAEEIDKLKVVSKVFNRALENDQTWFIVAQNLKLQVPAGMTARAAVYAKYEEKVGAIIHSLRTVFTPRELNELNRLGNVFQRYAHLKALVQSYIPQDHLLHMEEGLPDHFLTLVRAPLATIELLAELKIRFTPQFMDWTTSSNNPQKLDIVQFLLSKGVKPTENMYVRAIDNFRENNDPSLWEILAQHDPRKALAKLEEVRINFDPLFGNPTDAELEALEAMIPME